LVGHDSIGETAIEAYLLPKAEVPDSVLAQSARFPILRQAFAGVFISVPS
jgi:hypothetical protein